MILPPVSCQPYYDQSYTTINALWAIDLAPASAATSYVYLSNTAFAALLKCA